MSISEEFRNVLSGGGSIAQECSCGKFYFVSEGDFNKGELERYRKQAKAHPEEYIEYEGDDYVGYYEIQGQVCVVDCTCRKLEKYENFIWSHREMIGKYIQSRAKMEKEEYDKVYEIIGNVENIVVDLENASLNLKKEFHKNGNLKSVYCTDKNGYRIGRQRDWSEAGIVLDDFVWKRDEYQEIIKISMEENAKLDESEINFWHFVKKNREENDQPF